MKLNCDLGESYGAWSMGLDNEVMPHIDQANIACGFHGGDPLVIQKTIALAKHSQVSVGAHPSYPDLVGFGRRSMQCSREEIIAFVHYQVAALDGMADVQGINIDYVKPHGALYNDMMKKTEVLEAILTAIQQYPKNLALMLQASPEIAAHRAIAKKFGIELYAEAFADRAYDNEGRLVSRAEQGAVLDRAAMLLQVEQLVEQGTVTTISGKPLTLDIDSLCVHGDNPEGVQAISDIKALINSCL